MSEEWKWNPKTKGSGIITCIPQTGKCPNGCEDCFFQSGRSYLEPLDENLPHVAPWGLSLGRIVRVNDGNDSNIDRDVVEKTVREMDYEKYFFNTAIPKDLDKFSGPVVLTVNPGKMTDTKWHKLEEPPENLMFVRIRVNAWNMLSVVMPAVQYYTNLSVPVVLTFMAYYEEKPEMRDYYIYRQRTTNSYYAITTQAWEEIMYFFRYNAYVYSCGKIEGENGTTKCSRCGNCIREYYNAKERIRN